MIGPALQQRDERVRAVRAAGTVNGIDHLEIASPDQRSLRVVFVHPLPGEAGAVPAGPPLTRDQLRIDGGVRIRGIEVVSVTPADTDLTVEVDQAGDYATYTLSVVSSPFDDAPPAGFDPVLSTIDFGFKVECRNDFDCEAEGPARAPSFAEPVIDYTARDYASFRQLMIERLGALMPGWTERGPAGLEVMLTEALAATADHLAYFQDAVGTETYLGTARRRTSLRRIARMLDFRVHDGCNARAWVQLTVAEGGDADGAVLPPATPLAVGASDEPVLIRPDAMEELSRGTTVFESLHELPMWAAQNEIALHTWSGAITYLPAGATGAALLNDPDRHLRVGDALLLEEVRSPTTGAEADADRAHRQVVRLTEVVPGTDPLDGTAVVLVRWHPRDALAFDLCLATELVVGGAMQVVVTGVARGNLVLADHGRTMAAGPGLDPAVVPDSPRSYRPVLSEGDVTFSEPYTHADALARPAAAVLEREPRKALAAVSLSDGQRPWMVQADLLGSDRFAPVFVTEPEHDGSASLRFGDGVHGIAPNVGDAFTAVVRIGNGPAGNVGAEALRRIVTDFQGITGVRNPLPGEGGQSPEGSAEIRRSVPQAFRVPKRAVTERDWAEVAARHPEVQRARARFRWTGSWYTVFVTIDRLGGLPVLGDPQFREEILAHLDRHRIAGYDLELREPLFVPLEIELRVCLEPGHFAADVREALTLAFGSGRLPDGTRGFFHPDEFTFGQALYLSRIYARALAVEGVASAQALVFQRWGRTAAGELAGGRVVPAADEILRCDSDPSFPENGLISFVVQGESV